MTSATTVQGEDSPSDSEPSARTHRLGSWRRELGALAELFAVAGLAFAQPIFDLLSKNVSLLIVSDATPFEIILLVLGVLALPPTFAYLCEVVAALVLPSSRRWIHLAWITLFAAVLAEEVFKQATQWGPTALVTAGVVGGIVVGVVVLRFEAARSFLRVLAIAPFIFAALFLVASPVAPAVLDNNGLPVRGVDIHSPHRVVMIVMDEFPLESLLDGAGGIDASMYPNFAALAHTSTWYRNTTSVAPWTPIAVSAIADGRYPRTREAQPTAADHPDSIFRLLGGAYRMNVSETVTRLCAARVCGSQSRGTIPDVVRLADRTASLWREFASPERTRPSFARTFDSRFVALDAALKFVRHIRRGAGPELDFLHVLMPHQPWRFLPSLQDNLNREAAQGAPYFEWQDAWSATSARQRHLIAVQAADTLLGRIRARLEALGEWDDSVVALTADHGMAFRAGEPQRAVYKKNAPDILWVPLFIKAAGQESGRVDDRAAQTIDVVPTIADLIDVKIPWKVDGISLLGTPRQRLTRRMYQWKEWGLQPPIALEPKGNGYLKFPNDAKGFREVLATRAAAPIGDPLLRPYRIGKYGALIGQRVQPLVHDLPGGPQEFSLRHASVFDIKDPNAHAAPWTYLEGYLLGIDEPREVAIAVNGSVAGITMAQAYPGTGAGLYWVSLAPRFFKAGHNEIEAYAISGTADAPQLDPVRRVGYRSPG